MWGETFVLPPYRKIKIEKNQPCYTAYGIFPNERSSDIAQTTL